MKFGSDPPALVAATITLGAGVSTAFVGEAELPAFLMTIGSGAGLTAGAGLAAAKEPEILGEPFATGSASLSEVSVLSAAAVACEDFTVVFGGKVLCEFGVDVFVEVGPTEDGAG